MTNLDVDALARFIIARKMYLEVTAEIFENPGLLLADKDIVIHMTGFLNSAGQLQVIWALP